MSGVRTPSTRTTPAILQRFIKVPTVEERGFALSLLRGGAGEIDPYIHTVDRYACGLQAPRRLNQEGKTPARVMKPANVRKPAFLPR